MEAEIFLLATLGVIVLVFLQIYNALILKPKKLRSKLQKQGINGPPPSFLLGNILEMKRIQQDANTQKKVGIFHNWPSAAFAYLEKFIRDYGNKITFSNPNSNYISSFSFFARI